MRARGYLAVAVCLGACSSASPTAAQLGELMFNDQRLSTPPGQACADCHAPSVAFRDPESDHSTSGGAIAGRFGARNAPTAMYARYVPPLRRDPQRGWIGGLFWDGRANSLEEQAGRPLLEPLEMNNPDKAAVVEAVRRSSYAPMFREVFGPSSLDDVAQAFAHVTEALAAFERTATFAPFSSKYDRYLAGQAQLTFAERRGLAIFEDPARGNCASCHPSRPSGDGTPPLFTDFSYENLGIPRYGNSMFFIQPPALNPAGASYVDHGLANTVGDLAEDGKVRVPTLRNIARSGPYGHNGYFENLPYLIDFLNTRDGVSADPAVGAWAAPEVTRNVDQRVGHLGLSAQDMADLVAFLATLTDEPPSR